MLVSVGEVRLFLNGQGIDDRCVFGSSFGGSSRGTTVPRFPDHRPRRTPTAVVRADAGS